jgi:hypothetical protein
MDESGENEFEMLNNASVDYGERCSDGNSGTAASQQHPVVCLFLAEDVA